MIKIRRAKTYSQHHKRSQKIRLTLSEMMLTPAAKPYYDSRDPIEHDVTQYPNHLVPINLQTHVLRDTFLKQLENKIDICDKPVDMDSINETDTYYEFDISTFFTYPKKEMQRILQKHKVIVCDFEDGLGGRDIATKGGGAEGTWINHVIRLRVMPREIIYLTTNINNSDMPELNIKTVSVPAWLHITIGCTGFLSHAYTNSDAKQTYLDMLDRQKNFALCPNFKPRAPRLAFLAELHKQDLLSTMDWSLIGYNQDLKMPYTHGNEDYWKFFDKSNKEWNLPGGDFDSFNQVLPEYREQYYNDVHDFLSSYELPKLLPNAIENPSNIVSISDHLVGKYYWHIVNETMLDAKVPMIKYGIITEKTFKAMIAGAMPLISGPKGTVGYLNNLGFKVYETDIDNYNNLGKSYRLAEIYKNLYEQQQLPDHNDVMHNAELILDKEFVCSTITKPILEHCNG